MKFKVETSKNGGEYYVTDGKRFRMFIGDIWSGPNVTRDESKKEKLQKNAEFVCRALNKGDKNGRFFDED